MLKEKKYSNKKVRSIKKIKNENGIKCIYMYRDIERERSAQKIPLPEGTLEGTFLSWPSFCSERLSFCGLLQALRLCEFWCSRRRAIN